MFLYSRKFKGGNGIEKSCFLSYNKKMFKTIPEEKIIKLCKKNKSLHEIQILFYEKININYKLKNGNSALRYAVHNGNLELVNFLISKGADINIQDNYGWTPLMLASFKFHDKIVEILIKNNAKFNIQNNLGETALYLSLVQVFGKKEITKIKNILNILLKAGADPTIKDSETGLDAFDVCQNNEFLKIIQIYHPNKKRIIPKKALNRTLSKKDFIFLIIFMLILFFKLKSQIKLFFI
jgi:hypothetical protein